MSTDREKYVLGTGLNVYLPENATRLELVSGASSVKSSVYFLLETPIGSRFMEPEFGSNLHTLVFEPIDETTLRLIEAYTVEAIETWIPRVARAEATTRPDPAAHRIDVDIRLELEDEPTPLIMVYPFYIQTATL